MLFYLQLLVNKEEVSRYGDQTNYETNNNLTNSNQTITVVNGMLKFEDYSHVQNTLATIEWAYLNHEDAFLAQYPGKTGDQLADIEDSINFNDYETYENFENGLSFVSLRSIIHTEYLNYINSTNVNAPEPDDHFIFEVPIQAILNEYEEVMIDSSIYKFYENGYIRIIDGDYATLVRIRQDYSLASTLSNVVIEGDVEFVDRAAGCNRFKGKGDNYDHPDGNKRIKWKVAIRSLPWSERYVIAASTNFQKKGGKWKQFRCYTKCLVWGEISDYQTLPDGSKEAACDVPITFNTLGGVYSDWNNKKSWQHKVFVETRTKSGWVKGFHYSYITTGVTYNSTLTF